MALLLSVDDHHHPISPWFRPESASHPTSSNLLPKWPGLIPWTPAAAGSCRRNSPDPVSWSRCLSRRQKKKCNFFCGSEDVDTRKLSQFYQRFTPQFTRIHVCKNWWKRIHRIKRVPDFQQGSSCSMVTFTTTWLKRKCSRGIWSDQNQQRSLLPC